ncbi:beta-glucan synthesis-associated protein KRE6 [Coprinopsis cinerea AmutBmut pab1-1]|nr:beta-glucan synthesis-associated protein KRE6 [Coprinopsis cinerea AmutBmut pab1-1]
MKVGLIDPDTPQEALTKQAYTPGRSEELILVFSDEFNVDGRTFYPGDDPYWEAVDLHYWGTNDLEWYDPSGATTEGGSLRLTLSRANPENNHNMNYTSGMVQTWNKFCFTGGLLEAAVRLPGNTNAAGLWPAVWAMGNLGRAGFGGSLDGMVCCLPDMADSYSDVPKFSGRTVTTRATSEPFPTRRTPELNFPNWRSPWATLRETMCSPTFQARNSVSCQCVLILWIALMGPPTPQAACTCPGESHPGPMRPDGSYVGRAAPEIDVIEALVENGVGQVSLSAQWAPYNAGYNWTVNSQTYAIHDPDRVHLNAYKGGVYQQTSSALGITNQDCYEEGGTDCFAVYGFEYKPGFEDGYITWINDDTAAWTILSQGMGSDPLTHIGARPIPQEPMYIIANLGFSLNFGPIDFDILHLPATMSVDYIRVYQPKDAVNIGCDPIEFPTAKYIETYNRAYTNPNISTWEQMEEPWPKNRLANGGTCD